MRQLGVVEVFGPKLVKNSERRHILRNCKGNNLSEVQIAEAIPQDGSCGFERVTAPPMPEAETVTEFDFSLTSKLKGLQAAGADEFSTRL